jgi:hypothetical protein
MAASKVKVKNDKTRREEKKLKDNTPGYRRRI